MNMKIPYDTDSNHRCHYFENSCDCTVCLQGYCLSQSMPTAGNKAGYSKSCACVIFLGLEEHGHSLIQAQGRLVGWCENCSYYKAHKPWTRSPDPSWSKNWTGDSNITSSSKSEKLREPWRCMWNWTPKALCTFVKAPAVLGREVNAFCDLVNDYYLLNLVTRKEKLAWALRIYSKTSYHNTAESFQSQKTQQSTNREKCSLYRKSGR